MEFMGRIVNDKRFNFSFLAAIVHQLLVNKRKIFACACIFSWKVLVKQWEKEQLGNGVEDGQVPSYYRHPPNEQGCQCVRIKKIWEMEILDGQRKRCQQYKLQHAEKLFSIMTTRNGEVNVLLQLLLHQHQQLIFL